MPSVWVSLMSWPISSQHLPSGFWLHSQSWILSPNTASTSSLASASSASARVL